MAKISTPDTPLSTMTLYNGRSTLANDPRSVDKMADRLATGCRRLAIPATMGRGRLKTYDDSIWEVTITVPPWTKAIGVRARGVCDIDTDDPEANVAFYYRYSGDGWDRYLTLSQDAHGSEAGTDYADVIHREWVNTIDNANDSSADIISSPLPVTVDDEPQEVTIQFKLETDLTVELYEYGLYVVPYDMQPYPDLP